MKRLYYRFIHMVERRVGYVIHELAKALNVATKGKLTPNSVTLALLVLHVFVIGFILKNHLLWAGLTLAILGLLDTIDGELARIQKKVTDIGGLLDAVSDRTKELILYAALLYLFSTQHQQPWLLVAVFVACGTSLMVPYIKAKGEAIITTYGHELAYDRLSRIFRDGAVSYGIRIAFLSLGLMIGHTTLHVVIYGIAAYGIMKLIERFVAIVRITSSK